MNRDHSEKVLRDAVIDGRFDDAKKLLRLLGYGTTDDEIDTALKMEIAVVKLTHNWGRLCVLCDKPIAHGRQEGRCIYAEPCGHRQGQGDAREFNRIER